MPCRTIYGAARAGYQKQHSLHHRAVGNRFNAASDDRPVVSRGVQTVFDSHVHPALVDRSLAPSAFGSMWLDMPRPESTRCRVR